MKQCADLIIQYVSSTVHRDQSSGVFVPSCVFPCLFFLPKPKVKVEGYPPLKGDECPLLNLGNYKATGFSGQLRQVFCGSGLGSFCPLGDVCGFSAAQWWKSVAFWTKIPHQMHATLAGRLSITSSIISMKSQDL